MNLKALLESGFDHEAVKKCLPTHLIGKGKNRDMMKIMPEDKAIIKDMLKEPSHLEIDIFQITSPEILQLLGYKIDMPIVKLDYDRKLKQIKLYKNGRLDVKFQSSALAEECLSEYLGGSES